MSVRVATAFADAVQESRVVGSVVAGSVGAQVVRRCRDIVELRAVARTSSIDVAVVDVTLRGLDRDVVEALQRSGVHVVGVAADTEPALPGSIALGFHSVVTSDLDGLSAALQAGLAGTVAGDPWLDQAEPRAPLEPDDQTHGRIVAVWGPPGAPGRTTVAIELAVALSQADQDVLLVDLDTVAPSIAQHLGLLDDASGLAAVARAAGRGAVSPEVLAALAVTVPAGPRVLTGLPTSARWPELRPAAVEAVFDCCRRFLPWTVLDVGSGVEGSDMDWVEPDIPKRFAAARRALASSDVVLCIGRSDPVGLARLLRELPQIQSLAPTADLRVVLNRSSGRRDFRTARDVVREVTGVIPVELADDPSGVGKAIAYGQPVASVASGSELVANVDNLVASLLATPGSYDLGREHTAGTYRRLLRRPHRRHRRRHAGVV